MPAKRIPQLDTLTGATSATDDKVVIYDVTTDATKAITRQELAKGLALDLASIQRVQNFSGNGSTTVFTLTYDPSTENNTQIYISGVYQHKNTYGVSGTTLTFSEAPPVGSIIEVMIQRA